jgi:hypothetical protein
MKDIIVVKVKKHAKVNVSDDIVFDNKTKFDTVKVAEGVEFIAGTDMMSTTDRDTNARVAAIRARGGVAFRVRGLFVVIPARFVESVRVVPAPSFA